MQRNAEGCHSCMQRGHETGRFGERSKEKNYAEHFLRRLACRLSYHCFVRVPEVYFPFQVTELNDLCFVRAIRAELGKQVPQGRRSQQDWD